MVLLEAKSIYYPLTTMLAKP